MTDLIQRFCANVDGRDFVVGDVHGHYGELLEKLRDIEFDFTKDRLFSVGDLVDRGPDSEKMVGLIAQSWFHPVRGNHEAMAVDYVAGYVHDEVRYSGNGGGWFMLLPQVRRKRIAAVFDALPYVIEVSTPHGRVGIVHAMVPCEHWNLLPLCMKQEHKLFAMMWGRKEHTRVHGIDLVVVGHTPRKEPVLTENVLCIDTGSGKGGPLTIIHINGENPYEVMKP